MVSPIRALGGLAMALAVTACVATPEQQVPDALPVMAWDHRPEAAQWTQAALDTLKTEGVALLSQEPQDITEWCPGYVNASEDERAAFWAGIMSALAKHESTWNPKASGGGGAWIGLTQIDPRTARGYGCEAKTAAELKDGAENISCAIRIASYTVPRDGYVASGREGLAADWGPFLSSKKRADMVAWTRSQSYCQG